MARSHNPQEQFEELKRKNRNRLIGATAFVTLGAGVLISALNHQQESSNEIVRVDMPGTPTVLSKAPEVQTEILQPALPQVAQETTPAPTETAKNIPESTQPEKAEKPVVTKTETKKTEKPVVTKTETKKIEKPVVTKTETKKTEKPVVTKTETKKTEKPVVTKTETKKTEKPMVTKTETKKAEKPVVTKTETKKTEKPVVTKTETKKTETTSKTDNKKLSPQEILNGKAGKTAANKTSTIQIGAFSSSQQAETQKAKLAQIGVNAKVHQAQSANGTVYRVRVQAASSAESERIVKRLKDNGFDSISVHQ